MNTKWLSYLITVVFIAFLLNSCSNSSVSPATGNDILPTDSNGEYITAGSKKGDTSGNYTAGAEEDASKNGGTGSAAREIVEADIYKVQGSVLWVLNRYKGLISIDVSNPEALTVLGRAAFKGLPTEMYVQEGRAYVLVNGLKYDEVNDKSDGYSDNRSMSELIVVDVSDPKNLNILGRYTFDGAIQDSRQVGDIIYVMASESQYSWYYCTTQEKRGYNRITLMSLNIAHPANIHEVSRQSLDGIGYSIFVSQNSIFVAEDDPNRYDYDSYYKDGFPVTYFDISDPAGEIIKRGEFKTGGFISDRWKMYEQNGVFFAVTSSDQWTNGDSTIEAFDLGDPYNVKKISEFTFMTGQKLYGTKFEDDRMYAVTYFQKDPLHVINITDPAHMTELGQLQVPGWSTHIEIRGTKLLTVGIDTTDSRAAKVSMYDVADPQNPKEMNTVSLGGEENGYSWSEANNDWKAFKIYDEIGLILVPTQEWSGKTYTEVNKLHLIDFDLVKGLTKRGSITSDGYVRRGVVIGDYIASVGDKTVMMVNFTDRDTPKVLSSLPVAYNVQNLVKCGTALCGISGDYYSSSQALKLQAYDATNQTNPVVWASPNLRGNYAVDITSSGNNGYLLAQDYSYYTDAIDGSYDYSEALWLHGFDFSGELPKFSGSTELKYDTGESSEQYRYYSYSKHFAATDNKAAGLLVNRQAYYCNDGTPEENCYYSNGYSYSKAKLFIYNTTDMTKESLEPAAAIDVRPLGWDSTVISRGNNLWYTNCKVNGYDHDGNEQLTCYAQSVDVSDPAKPVAKEKYSIPGELVGMSEDGTIFYTLHRTWRIEDNNNGRSSYHQNYFYHLYILKKVAGSSKLHIVSAVPFMNDYLYTNEKSEYTETNYVLQDKRVFVNTNHTVYTYDQEEHCSYWTTNMTRTSSIKIISAEDGTKLIDEDIADGYYMENVLGGGVIVRKQDTSSYYYYYYGTINNEFTYIAPDGTKRDVTLPDASYYASEYYYYNANSAVRIGDSLYISRGWEGIALIQL